MNHPGSTIGDDVSVNSFGSSFIDSSPRIGLDPRARSTSDLFEVPASRIKPKPYKRSSAPHATYLAPASQHSRQNLSLIPEQVQMPPNLPNMLTPYQKQRRRMKSSFQFPNGENFTPKQKPLKAFPSDGNSYDNNVVSAHTRGLPKSASCSNFHTGHDRTSLLRTSGASRHSIRSGSLTAASVPSSPTPIPSRFHKSASTSKLPLEGRYRRSLSPLPFNPSSKPSGATNSKAFSPHPIRDINNNSSRTQAVSSNNSTNSSNSLKSENVVSSNTSTDASETHLKPMAAAKHIVPSAVHAYTPKTSSNLQAHSAPSKYSESKTSSMSDKARIPLKPVQNTKVAQASTPPPAKGIKRSYSSRIGSFFRKLLPSKKNKNAIVKSESPRSISTKAVYNKTEAIPIETPKISVSRPSHSSSQDQITVSERTGNNCSDPDDINDGDNEVDDFDDDDDQLLDIDLVFDSLLLKTDHPVTIPSTPLKISSHKPNPDNQALTPVNRDKTKAEESNIDYGLIEEFSRLGSFITDESQPQKLSMVLPPARSLKRPLLANKESMVGFYRQHVSQNKIADPDARLDVNLKRDWKNIYYDTVITIVDVDQEPISGVQTKKLRFGHAVYVKDTYAAGDYERSDKRFIRARRRMMQTHDTAFIDAVKHQLNEFKKEEMKVHGESLKNTHYFL
ncbi:LAME_0G09802g1_1 [Lachancea meyersii CBS 8951]|uniref:LAME_0G09802g1_1 n=1 Tax=Lachancea meyersii CBS 8951 TaxID=1266667 RepID=A0A1G4K8Q7_9SACH|nr:LAME_0G09802g1_1 [Lachancea meyersii CBS 8951]